MTDLVFPKDFTWGAATAAWQVEGSSTADGKRPSVWDAFAATPGRIVDGAGADPACDHYRRMPDDVASMAELGLGAYRFSIAWPRVLPEGTGAVNAAGLDFYDRLVDTLLARGITPWATLFHWDLPLALHHRGGWQNPDSPAWFADYTAVVARRLGDRVRHWMTLNEPQMFVGLGHAQGSHAPGLRLGPSEIMPVIHHVLRAHGRSVATLRREAQQPGQIGWAPNVAVAAVDPAWAQDPEVVDHARRGQFALHEVSRVAQGSAVWSDPALLGRYPEDVLAALGHYLPRGWEADLAEIHQPLDFCGMNIYAAWGHHTRTAAGRLAWEPNQRPGASRTGFDWPITPSALYWGPRFFHERYRCPIVITENGMANHDQVDLDGRVEDPQRIDFLRRYLRELRRAVAEGVEVRGYFHWTLLDNVEWAEGHRQRFGLIHVDPVTQVRTLKSSARWYREVIASQGARL